MVAVAADRGESGAALPGDAIEVGRVVDAWGIKGWIRVLPLARPPQALFSCRQWFACAPERAPRRAAAATPEVWPRLLRIADVREHGDDVIAAVRDIDDRSAAETLRGARIFVPRASFPSVAEGEFYWVDLLGLQVVNRQGQLLGTVLGLIDTGVHSVLRVGGSDPAANGSETLIPFVAAYVDAVDRQAGCIVVDWGLDY